jgi:GT2 family glycosyltransferase
MTRPSVVAVVPYWHGEQWIARALLSISLNRTGWDIQTVVVDDGSSPDSAVRLQDIVGQFDQCTLLQVPHAGVAAARNRGVVESSSDLVAFLDQDDEWLGGKLNAQWAALQHNDRLRYVVGRAEFKLQEGYTRPAWCRPEWLAVPQAGFVPGALLIWREAFNEVGPFDPAFQHGADDVDWFGRARQLELPCEMLERVVVRRWVHDENQSRQHEGSADILAAVRRHARSHAGPGEGAP